MSNTFFDKSKEIANDFIQSIVFLDDRAYREKNQESPNHDFDTLKISQAFASENKICAVYKPESDTDINNFKIIADKADVIILDWQIVFQQEIQPGSEEEDAPDDPRGIYTKDVIKSVLFGEDKSKHSLKLIIIYTGDYTILEDIAEEIHKDVFNSSENYIIDKNEYSINSSQVKILIRSKKVEISNQVNKEKYESMMIGYENLPSFVLNEFTKMTSGLLSNFALISLTTLRKNSSKVVGLFSKEMDSAYMAHKATIPKQEDSEDLLVELFGDSIKDLLYYSDVNAVVREKLVESWIDENILEEDYEIGQKKIKRSAQMVKDIIISNEENIEERFSILGTSISKNEKKGVINNCTSLFTNQINRAESEKIDKKFSKLTHHKSIFLPKNTKPKLTLGSLIKSTKNDTYYICIQQKCDSVRIPRNNERKFLFIPLTVSTDKCDILTPDGIKLKKVKDSFSIRTIRFICDNDYGMVIADENESGEYIFQQKYNTTEAEHFVWILDLKDLHSQRIIIEYTSQLSRVGLNESEWHRKQLS